MKRTLTCLVVGVAMVMMSAVAVAGADTTTSTTTTSTTTTTTRPTTTTTVHHNPPMVTRNPFAATAMRRFLGSRTGRVTAGVYDVTSGKTYLTGPNVVIRTASMAKIDILATLLHETQGHGGLTRDERALAPEMIEWSDNQAAEALYTDTGTPTAMGTFDRQIGMSQTSTYWDWGSTETTPKDYLTLLKVIALPNRYLTTASREYELGLMRQVEPGQRFGWGWGSPSKATVAMKDGWRPDPGYDWEVNSAGIVRYEGRYYFGVVMSDHDPGMYYGEGTVTGVATLVYRLLRP